MPQRHSHWRQPAARADVRAGAHAVPGVGPHLFADRVRVAAAHAVPRVAVRAARRHVEAGSASRGGWLVVAIVLTIAAVFTMTVTIAAFLVTTMTAFLVAVAVPAMRATIPITIQHES